MNLSVLLLPAAALSAAAAMPSTAEARAKKDARPNIVIILADDLGFSDLGCYGGEISTPNLDRLAAEGLRFNRFYNTSKSCPTRSSLLTGLYAHQAGVGRMTFDEGMEGYRGDLSHNAVTIAEVLSAAGYNTGMVGKWHVAETPLQPDQRLWLAHQVYHPEFTDKANYPTHRGFGEFYGTIYGVVNYFDPFSLVNGEEPVRSVPKDYYSTVALSDTAVNYVNRYAGQDKPFFLYLAYHAPHWPLHALSEDIEVYKDTYTAGWEAIRSARYERIQKLGIFPGLTDFLTPRQPAGDWDKNPTAEWDARAMAVHAAMIHRMDRGIGQLVEALRRSGQLDNTLIFFLSDNGCSPENAQNYPPGENDRPDMLRDGSPVYYLRGKQRMPGPDNTLSSIGPHWANVANTPFRFWKAKAFEGGICTPMIAHWPKGLKKGSAGAITAQPGHVMDLMATCVELARTTYPETYAGKQIIPLEGRSLVPVLRGGVREGHAYLGFEHFTQRGFMAADGWKIVMQGDGTSWELYNLAEDRTELHNRAAEHPGKVAELASAYEAWARRTHVEPYPPMPK